jgi:hypothetical protein
MHCRRHSLPSGVFATAIRFGGPQPAALSSNNAITTTIQTIRMKRRKLPHVTEVNI